FFVRSRFSYILGGSKFELQEERMKRNREEKEMEIVWQSPANPPEKMDYIFRNDVLTICKPPSVPVHPCGQYCKNTVVGILQAEYDLAPLFPVHRLDRLVSGLLILARNASKADMFRQQ
ncbi:hypothetical protein UlMin_018559, partial [Ulmus minor]